VCVRVRVCLTTGDAGDEKYARRQSMLSLDVGSASSIDHQVCVCVCVYRVCVCVCVCVSVHVHVHMCARCIEGVLSKMCLCVWEVCAYVHGSACACVWKHVY